MFNITKSRIARVLILYMILFSSFLTLIITALQLLRDYNTDLDLIEQELNQIESVHLKSLTASLWASNKALLQTGINGLYEVRDIEFVEISDDLHSWVKVGKLGEDNKIIRKYPMIYHHRNKDIVIGSLDVSVSLDGVYQRLLDKVWVILISNGIKTSFVAIFMYFLFYHLVAKHLAKITTDLKRKKNNLIGKELQLNRNTKNRDELNYLVDSLNELHKDLHAQISNVNEQKQYLSQTLNSIGDAVITTDIDGNVSRMNPVAEALTGWTNEAANGQSIKSVFSIVDSVSGEVIENPIDNVINTGETVYLSDHTILLSKNGSKYHIADSAAAIRDGDNTLGMVLVFNDVTETKKIHRELIESEERFRQLADNLEEVFWLGSPDWQEVYYISPAYEKNWQLDISHLYKNGRAWLDAVHPHDRENVIADIPTDYANIDEYIDFREFRIIQPDGTIIWIKARAYPIYDEQGSVIRIAGIAEDITSRKSSENIIRRTQKMDALGKLTGGVAHDYNNMLGVVMGYAELLGVKLAEQPDLLKYTNEIIHAGQRGAKLTQKLLSFSSKTSSNAECLSLINLLESQKMMFEKTLTASIRLSFTHQDDLWSILVDESDMEDALLNMLINAMHAMAGEGEVSIETSNVHLNEIDMHQTNKKPGDYVLLSITDNGCGMTNESLDKIFEPFYSTKGDSGTGLGLSQVYGFTERSGGYLKVYSEPDKGTCFNLYFPRHNDESYVAVKNEDDNVFDFSGNESILVVDDEPALVNLTTEILAGQGYTVFGATSAEQALLLLESESIDLLLSDVIMPGINGYELASIVLNLYPHIKIQMASGFSDERHIKNADENLKKNIIHKPFQSNVLLEKIRKLLDS